MCERHAQKLIQAGKRLDLALARIAGDDPSKAVEREMFHDLCENQLAFVHRTLQRWVSSQGRKPGSRTGDIVHVDEGPNAFPVTYDRELAVIEPYVAEAQQARSQLQTAKGRPEEVLSGMAQQTLDILTARQSELRIFWRDLEQFPKLQSKVRREIMQHSYRVLSAWLLERSQQGEIREHDSEAVAVVLLGSLTMFKVFEALWGEKTMPISDRRFHEAWRDIVLTGLGLQASTAVDTEVSPIPSARETVRAKRRRQ
ncbi:MAG: TetR/AcrR family transcriptional regulator C-terminal domain-containing protein [Rudaea sp.]|uniref:TetR/AcrR family transcriptional regulator C-terminal domain-containing protein n=1 Tax=Rudaea sp. TaxID=2136325 RepID=UPI0039E6D85A